MEYFMARFDDIIASAAKLQANMANANIDGIGSAAFSSVDTKILDANLLVIPQR